MESDDKPPLLSRLGEIRKRLVLSAIAVGIGFAIAYGFSEKLFGLLAYPLKVNMAPGDRLVYTGLPEIFLVYIKTALVAGLLLAAPYVFYQFYLLVAPGYYQKEKRNITLFVLSSTVLFVGGSLFGYFVVFPIAFRFFLGFAQQNMGSMQKLLGGAVKVSVAQKFDLTQVLMMGEYFSLVWKLLCGSCSSGSSRLKRSWPVMASGPTPLSRQCLHCRKKSPASSPAIWLLTCCRCLSLGSTSKPGWMLFNENFQTYIIGYPEKK